MSRLGDGLSNSVQTLYVVEGLVTTSESNSRASFFQGNNGGVVDAGF
jgi:hypothetical protein